MKTIQLSINKASVYNEVEKTTNYVGDKFIGDQDAYERITVTDSNKELLERFWNETCNGATSELKPFIKSLSDSIPIDTKTDVAVGSAGEKEEAEEAQTVMPLSDLTESGLGTQHPSIGEETEENESSSAGGATSSESEDTNEKDGEAVESVEKREPGYMVTLELSEAFDESLRGSMESSLYSYFVLSITAKWFTVTNKGESASYAKGAHEMLEDVKRKVYYKKKPSRPRY